MQTSCNYLLFGAEEFVSAQLCGLFTSRQRLGSTHLLWRDRQALRVEQRAEADVRYVNLSAIKLPRKDEIGALTEPEAAVLGTATAVEAHSLHRSVA